MNEIFQRRSVRSYTNTPVDAEKVECLLRAAMASPSAQNGRPWEFYVVTNQEILQALSTCSPFSRHVKDAPLAIVPCYRKELKRPDFVLVDMGICTQNILLEAVSQGLGAVCVGIAPMRDRMDNVRNALGLSDKLEPFAIIPCGYPAVETEMKDRYEEDRIHFLP